MQTDMDSTNIYAYISIIALIVCIPPAVIVSETCLNSPWKFNLYCRFYIISCLAIVFGIASVINHYLIPQLEGPTLLKHGFNDAIAKVGLVKFVSDLFWVGMFYHLYNQVNPSFWCNSLNFGWVWKLPSN